MKPRKTIRILVGMLLWAAAGIGLAVWWQSTPDHESQSRVASQLVTFASGQRRAVEFQAPQTLPVVTGTPVFATAAAGEFEQVGEVSWVEEPAEALGEAPAVGGRLVLYSSAPSDFRVARLTYQETPRSMDWVLRTMLPEEKRSQISRELSDAFAENHEEILASLQPIFQAAFHDSLPVVEEAFVESLARHQPELEQLGAKYQKEIVDRELLPLVKEEVWPIVVRHAEPVATEIGGEMWQRASLWRFGWRYAYDISPLPEKRLLSKEWRRFVSEEATPVFESHLNDFMILQKRILRDVARNPRVQAASRRSMLRLLEDPELQRIVFQIVRESVLENQRLHDVLQRHWQSDEARSAFRLASARLEPTVARIGQILVGSPHEGITPEFAAVLRNRVLGKDRRWLVIEFDDGATSGDPFAPSQLVVERGPEDAPNPFVSQPVVNAFRR